MGLSEGLAASGRSSDLPAWLPALDCQPAGNWSMVSGALYFLRGSTPIPIGSNRLINCGVLQFLAKLLTKFVAVDENKLEKNVNPN